ncbi:hypothetical protein [Hymenobacter cheonanensis]|uniref:hypothetical protein n=1 Tax=Hymenobacter sp. CA2-7 TaxID=3063993 RepID=UPI002712CC8B|nr:hypothetical protein [Hymenobacter sp. CA2-7]MDO7886787.1 hypothetical protein [Hymenobacter sp. CA2-7]
MPDSPTPSTTQPGHWGRWVLLGLAVLLLAALAWLKWGLDPWLRGKLEAQVATQTHGQYTLSVASLRTRLLARSLHLDGLRLRPTTANLADTLPRLTARLASLDLSGVGLLALLRGRTVPIDSLTLDSLRLEVAALARRPAPHPGPPLYQQRPLRLGYVALRHVGGHVGPAAAPIGELADGQISARDLLFTPAGAADTQRLAFAASWQALLRGPVGRLGGHTIAAHIVDFSSTRQQLGLDSLRIVPPAPGQGKPGAVRVFFTMPRVRMVGLRAATWQHQHRLRADSVRLSQPRLTFRPPAQAPPPLWQLLRPVFRRADVRQLAIDDGYLAVVGVQEAPAVRHVVGVARGLRIDSTSQQAPARRVLYAQGWTGHTGRLTATFAAPLYPASIEHAFVDTDHQALRLTTLALRPTLSPAQLNQRSGYQSTQLTVRMDELRAQGFDFRQLSANSHVHIARVIAERPYLLASSDGRGPINHHPSYLTPENMRHVRAHLDVRQLDLRNGTIEARYRSARTPLVGTFSINRLNATLRNVSNDPGRMSLAHPLTGTASGYLQNACRAEVQLTTSLLDPRGRQHLRGSFGAAPFSILNPILTPTRLVNFKSGRAQRIDFDEYLDRQRISGTVRARYTNLRLNFLGYQEGEVKKTFFGRIKSGLVNVVVRDQNPRPGGRFVVGAIQTPRELEFSVFTAWRQGLIVGFLHSVGVPKKLADKYGQAGGGTPLPSRTDAPSQPATAAAAPPPARRGPGRWLHGAIRRVKRLAKRLQSNVKGQHGEL